jgi:hypothetical protein
LTEVQKSLFFTSQLPFKQISGSNNTFKGGNFKLLKEMISEKGGQIFLQEETHLETLKKTNEAKLSP